MKRFFDVNALRQNQSGATMIEYALIAGLIALAVIVSATALGLSLQDPFETLSGTFADQAGGNAGDPAPAEGAAQPL